MRIILMLCMLCCGCRNEKQYCGVVVTKGYEQPTSGHKTHTNAKYFIIMSIDSINAAIRVNLTVPAWYSLQINDRACFNLDIGEMQQYGNGSKHLIK